MRKAHLPPAILTTYYRGSVESILSSCTTVWYGNSTVLDRKTIQHKVRKDHWSLSFLHHRHLLNLLHPQTYQHCGGPHTPLTHTLHQPTFWQETPEHSRPHCQTAKQFLPPSCQTPENSETRLADTHLYTFHYLKYLLHNAKVFLHNTMSLLHHLVSVWFCSIWCCTVFCHFCTLVL